MQSGSIGGTVAIATLQGVTYNNAQIVSIATSEEVHQDQEMLYRNEDSINTETDDQTEKDKRAIYRHPLFPLMALLFERCEQASQTSECPSSDSFDVDIQAFVQHQENDKKPFFIDDPELDGLMVKAIQVLRIHLLELEKVSDLCKDFCTRYITCLKGKLQSEQLLRIDSSGLEGDEFGPVPGTPTAPISNSATVSSPYPAAGQIVSGGTVYQMLQTPQGLVAQPIQIQPSVPVVTSSMNLVAGGNTPLSQIGVSMPTSPPMASATREQPSMASSPSVHSPTSGDEDKRAKRGVLPKQATQVMKSWLFQHIVHPYPTEDEKKELTKQTGLSLLQINNWFINARRRILQPMLDASNPDAAKSKKPKPPQNRPSQRFWPENIANMQMKAEASNTSSQDSDNMDEEELENSSSPQQLESNLPHNSLPANTPLVLSSTGQLMTTDGQLVHTTPGGQLTLVHSQSTSPANVSISNMVDNVQRAAALVVENGVPVAQEDVPVASEETVEETEDYGDNVVKMDESAK